MSGITRNKKFLLLAVLGAGLVAASLATATSFASAQNATNVLGNNSSSTGSSNGTAMQGATSPAYKSGNNTQPAIVGTISIRQAEKNFLDENVKITLADASSKAVAQVVNGTAVKGCLGAVQGYLVYTITVANMGNGTLQKVIVDAGNGSVLYTSPATPTDHSSFGRVMDGAFHTHHHHHRHHY